MWASSMLRIGLGIVMNRFVVGFFGIATALAAVPASATQFVTNGGFETTTLTSSGQMSSDTGTQYVSGWTNGSVDSGNAYQYSSSRASNGGQFAGYSMLMVNAAATGSIATNDNGKMALWGQATTTDFTNDVRPGDHQYNTDKSKCMPTACTGTRAQVSNGFKADNLGSGGNFVAADGAYAQAPMYQLLSNLTVGKSYVLTFDFAAAQQYGYDGATDEWWDATFTGASTGKQTTFETVHDSDTNHGFVAWSKATFYFTATDAQEYLSFLAGSNSSGLPPFSLLDNVGLTEAPEPSSWIMMLVGFGAVGYAMRRRRRVTECAA